MAISIFQLIVKFFGETMINPIIDLIFKHRSVRRFDPEFDIPDEHISSIITAGQQASTSCTGQMYSVIEISKKLREKVYSSCGKQQFVRDASFFCIILLDLHRLRRIVELCDGENPTWNLTSILIGTFDAGLMAQNMALTAESLGYDLCFCGSCGDNPEQLIDLLSLPDHTFPLTGLAIGRGLENPPIRPRLPASLVHHIDKYNQTPDQDLQKGIEYMSLKLNEEGYYRNYTTRPDGYQWRDHMRNKFGGKWLNDVEKRRRMALKKQKFLD
jgi:nitroreductase